MIVFWIMTGLAAAMAGLLVLTGARRGADAAGADADVGGRELDELDRLKARGLLDETAHAVAPAGMTASGCWAGSRRRRRGRWPSMS